MAADTRAGGTLGLWETLTGGMDREAFFARIHRRRFLHLPGSARALLPALPTLAEVEALLAREAVAEDEAVRFLGFPRSGTPVVRNWLAPRKGAAPRDLDEAVNLFAADRHLPSLRPLADELSRIFETPSNLQLFHARRGAGVRPHSDIHDSFVIQMAGRKRWRFVDPPPPGAPLPPGNAGGVLPDDAATVILEPGDVLYKPSHAVHATESLDERTLSLTASIVTRTAADVLLDWLSAQLAFDPAWRTRMPFDAGDTGSSNDARASLTAALATLSSSLPDVESLVAFAGAAPPAPLAGTR